MVTHSPTRSNRHINPEMAHIDSLKAKRTAFKTRITKCKNFLDVEGSEAMSELLEIKLQTIKEKHTEWERNNASLLELDVDNQATNTNDAYTIEESDDMIVARLRRLIKDKMPAPSQPPASQQTPLERASYSPNFNMKLPEITLPTFDGRFEMYRPFKDQFNARLPNHVDKVTRLQYLQTSRKEEAAQAIEALEITAENYDIAWALLDKKFAIPRQALRRHCSHLLNIGKRTRENNKSLIDLVNSVRQQLRSINSFGTAEDQLNGLVCTIILNQLDEDLVFQWETLIERKEMPKHADLLDILEKRGICASRAQTFFTNTPRKCPVCTEGHRIYECPKFAEMYVEKRKKLIFNQNRCLNCFAKGHDVKECNSKGYCKTCNDPKARHHSLLHHIKELSTTPESANSSGPDILPTAVINLLDRNHELVQCRALIDTASTKSFITQELAAKLGIKRLTCSIPVGALNELSTIAHHRISTTILSRLNNFKKELNFLIVPRIFSLVPSEQIDRKSLEIPMNLALADAHFHKPSPILVLLGCSTSTSILSVGQLKLPKAADTYLQKTLFGWIVCGSLNNEFDHSQTERHFTEIIEEFKKFWKIEDIGLKESRQSETEAACQAHFQQHVSRNTEGRYVVTLPFNEKKDQIGTSFLQAKRRLLSLEKKFQWNSQLAEDYTKVVNEYKELGHMKKIETDVEDGFYLPHHAVFKDTSLTTKTRVVFDGSARSSTGVSLNDALMVGPTIQDDILALILRLRLHNYIFTGDIEKLYRQVLIRPEDTIYQRILWRENNEITTYELQTVTFGQSSAPYLAVRCVQQLADDEQERYPTASTVLKKDLYVDDLLTGTTTLEEALLLRDEMVSRLEAGGFNLRQCATNSPQVLQGLSESTVNLQRLGGDDSTHKTLGIHWDSQKDSIVYTVNPIATRDTITMRTIASDVARIFDPLGLLNPVVTHAKIIQQELWRLKLNWDDSTPAEIHTRWYEFASQLPLLNETQFKRQVTTNLQHLEVHGFCDASQNAYGACIYLRSVQNNGKGQVNLYCTKSRITPLKGQRTSRLNEKSSGVIPLYRFIGSRPHLIFFNDSWQTGWLESKKLPSMLIGDMCERMTTQQMLYLEVNSLLTFSSMVGTPRHSNVFLTVVRPGIPRP
ncbi:uncharacterized protein LOC135159920 [Diachasmimorpha longicaudata]|uniref:uncharacterized protein LOC135159920 n=1 Tax=Diachasmimorpha longicaudata TaxID=58733 RepID=UPI0030B8A45D